MSESPQQWILHLDMDAFYASVEQLDFPEYRGKPLIIGGTDRGVVSTCSYEARKFGVRSAMPVGEARKLCPRGIFIQGRRERYLEKSTEIMQILHSYSPIVEQASIDEAFLDFTGLAHLGVTAEAHALDLQEDIKSKTGLTCSIGLAPIKFLAKIASDIRKPAGFYIIHPHQVPKFLHAMPVQKIPGVGKQTLTILHAFNVFTAGDVLRHSKDFWVRHLGKGGEQLFDRASGIDPRKVEPYTEPKSESAENTFAQDISDMEELCRWLLAQSERVGTSLRRNNIAGRTITLKVKYADFTQLTRSKTFKFPINSTKTIYETARALLQELAPTRPLRLIGVGVSQFGAIPQQLSLFPEKAEMQEQKALLLDETLDTLRDKFGKTAVIRGKLFVPKKKESKEDNPDHEDLES